MRAVAGLFGALVLGALVLGALVVGALIVLGVGALPATADGTLPPAPPGVTIPSPGSMPTGPTYVITPGVGGSTLPAPVDPKVAAAHAAAADKSTAHPRHRKHPAVKPTGRATTPVVQRADPADTSKQDLAWEIGAGALLVLVLSEVFRLGVRRGLRPRTT